MDVIAKTVKTIDRVTVVVLTNGKVEYHLPEGMRAERLLAWRTRNVDALVEIGAYTPKPKEEETEE